jgi:hypothetical protein
LNVIMSLLLLTKGDSWYATAANIQATYVAFIINNPG